MEATDGQIPIGNRRKNKIPNHLRRDTTKKEMDGYTKRVLSIPDDEPFDETYYTLRLYMFFQREPIIRALKKRDANLTKKGNPGKFVFPCTAARHVYQNAMCDK